MSPASPAPALVVVGTDDPVIVGYRQRATEIRKEAVALVIVDAAAKVSATELLAGIARINREAESKRVELVTPHNHHVKHVNDTFKAVLAPVVEADRILRDMVLAFDREQRRLAAEAEAKAERDRLAAEALLQEAERAEAAGHSGVAEVLLNTAVAREESAKVAQTQAVAPARTIVAPMGGAATVKKVWTFTILDLVLVPRSYLVLDETKVREAIRAGVREIPGLNIFQSETLAVRR